MALSLAIPYSILFIFAGVQLGLISDTVGFLHIQKTEVRTYPIVESSGDATTFLLNALPANLIVDHGHTTNAAAGWGVVLSLAGLLGVWFLFQPRFSSRLRFKLLLAMTICLTSLTLLTLAAFIYTFIVTYQTRNQTISLPVAIGQSPLPYQLNSWTPETWYRAVLQLSIADKSVADTLRFHYHEMAAWRWWILPYLLVSAFTLGCTAVHALQQRRMAVVESESKELKK
ncbi:hypothetical protein VTN77DRAFT_451 [Rasamsonia byssochlamydoides]|uniref:uncharacterized protein n=1 Tax=Rasamsonia byssochlamydoides TaxID=89139 RepID=UPI0037436CB4